MTQIKESELLELLKLQQQKTDSLESQLIFQEDIIEQLNQIVTQQQQEIALLNTKLSIIVHKLSSLQSSNIASLEEETPPPHY